MDAGAWEALEEEVARRMGGGTDSVTAEQLLELMESMGITLEQLGLDVAPALEGDGDDDGREVGFGDGSGGGDDGGDVEQLGRHEGDKRLPRPAPSRRSRAGGEADDQPPSDRHGRGHRSSHTHRRAHHRGDSSHSRRDRSHHRRAHRSASSSSHRPAHDDGDGHGVPSGAPTRGHERPASREGGPEGAGREGWHLHPADEVSDGMAEGEEEGGSYAAMHARARDHQAAAVGEDEGGWASTVDPGREASGTAGGPSPPSAVQMVRSVLYGDVHTPTLQGSSTSAPPATPTAPPSRPASPLFPAPDAIFAGPPSTNTAAHPGVTFTRLAALHTDTPTAMDAGGTGFGQGSGDGHAALPTRPLATASLPPAAPPAAAPRPEVASGTSVTPPQAMPAATATATVPATAGGGGAGWQAHGAVPMPPQPSPYGGVSGYVHPMAGAPLAPGPLDGGIAPPLGDDRVMVRLSQLRDTAALVDDLQDQLRLTERERDTALARADTLQARLNTMENDAARERSTFRGELDRLTLLHSAELERVGAGQRGEMARLSAALVGKDDTIALLRSQVDALQGQLASRPGWEAVGHRGLSPHGYHPPGPHAGTAPSATEEDLVLLSEEVGSLQRTVADLSHELAQARSQLAMHEKGGGLAGGAGTGAPPPPSHAGPGTVARTVDIDAPPSPGGRPPMSTAAKLAALRTAAGAGGGAADAVPSARAHMVDAFSGSNAANAMAGGGDGGAGVGAGGGRGGVTHSPARDWHGGGPNAASALAVEGEHLHAEIAKLRTQLQSSRAMGEELQEMVAAEKRKAAAAAEAVDAKVNELMRAQAALDEVRREAGDRDRDVRKLMATLTTSEADCERWKRRALAAEEAIGLAQKEADHLRADVELARQAAAAAEDKLTRRMREIEEWRSEAMALRDALRRGGGAPGGGNMRPASPPRPMSRHGGGGGGGWPGGEVQALAPPARGRRLSRSPPPPLPSASTWSDGPSMDHPPPRVHHHHRHAEAEWEEEGAWSRHDPPAPAVGRTRPPVPQPHGHRPYRDGSVEHAPAPVPAPSTSMMGGGGAHTQPSHPPSPPRVVAPPAPQPANPYRFPMPLESYGPPSTGPPPAASVGGGGTAASAVEQQLAAARARYYEAERLRGVGVPPPAVPAAAPAPSAAQAAAEAERNRRLAILADIAGTGSGGPPPPAYTATIPAAVRGGGGGLYGLPPPPPGMVTSMDGPPPAAAPSLPANATTLITDSLPFSAAALRKQQEEARARESVRLSKGEADAAAAGREASAPFATAAAADTSATSTLADYEARLLALNQEKTAVAGELEKLGPGAPRTLRDRDRKAALLAQAERVERQLSDVRIWLKAHAKG